MNDYGPGSFTAEHGDIQFRFNLGWLANGDRAPTLWVHRRTPNTSLSTPASLHIAPRKMEQRHGDYAWGYMEQGGLEIVYDSSSSPRVRQVLAPQVFADVLSDSADPYEYQIRFYHPSSVTAVWTEGVKSFVLTGNPEPFRIWVVQNPAASPTDIDQLRISEYLNATTKVAQYDYAYSSVQNSWTLVMSDGQGNEQRTETSVRTPDYVNHQTVQTLTVTQGSSILYQSTSTHMWFVDPYNSGISGERLISEKLGPAADPLMQSVRTYWMPVAPGVATCKDLLQSGKLKSILKPDGSWLLRDYDTMQGGRCDGLHSHLTTEVRPVKDQPMPSEPWTDISQFVTTGYATTHYDYTALDPYDNASGMDQWNYPKRPRTVTEKVDGIPVRKTLRLFINGNQIQEQGVPNPWRWEETAREVRCINPSSAAPLTDAGNLVTETEYYAMEGELSVGVYLPARVKSVTFPDGRRDSYTYARGIYVAGNPQSEQRGTFTPDAGGKEICATITHGSTTNPNGIALKTTIENRFEDAVGQPLLREVYVKTATGSELIEWTEWVRDNRGRVTHSFSSNHRHAETAWQDCCRHYTQTDETGTETEFEYDAMGRRSQETRKGLTSPAADILTTYTPGAWSDTNGGGYRETTTVSAGTGTGALSLSSRVEYDTAGRVVKTVDQAGLETTYAYSFVEQGGGKQITKTLPGGATEIQAYYRDGRIKSITGTAVVSTYYDYSVDANGNRWTWQWTGTEDEADSPFVTHTAVNPLDQTIQVIEYHGTGLSNPVTTNHYYNNKGQLVRTEKLAGANKLVADTVYEYDEMGELTRSGLDIGGTAYVLDNVSSDRIQETEKDYWQDENLAWWDRTVRKVYTSTTGTGSPVTTSTVLRQLTGLAANEISRTVSIDANGNQTKKWTTVNRDNKQVIEYTDLPDSTTNEIAERLNGLLVSSRSKTNLTTGYSYDALGRQVGVTDPRTGLTTTCYRADGRIEYTSHVVSIQGVDQTLSTQYDYYPSTHLNAGRLKSVTVKSTTDPAGKKQYFSYTARSEQQQVWGDTAYPVEYGYDDWGRKTSMKTYQDATVNWTTDTWPGGQAAANKTSTTTWVFGTNGSSPWLTRKLYADNTATQYTYKPDGRLETRTWARASGSIVTIYSYDPSTGEITGIDYSDSTPDVTFSYTRAGQQYQIGDAVGTRTFTYRAGDLQLDAEAIAGAVGMYSKTITRLYQDSTYADPKVLGRPAGLRIGSQEAPEYLVSYRYDDPGRVNQILGPGLDATYGARYERLTNSEAVQYVRFKGGTDNDLATIQRHYEDHRDLLDYVQNKLGATEVSTYAYVNDSLGRRTSTVLTGTAFTGGSGDHHWNYGYNDRSELTGGNRKTGTDVNGGSNLLANFDFDYGYDPIGNRTTSNVDNAANPTGYTASLVNAYTATTYPTESFGCDDDGNLISDVLAGPRLVAARSYKTHGTAGEFYIDLPLNAPSAAGIESRNGGPTSIELEFSEEVTIAVSNLVLSSGTCSGVTQPTAGVPKYRVTMSGATANAGLSIMLKGVTTTTTGRSLVGTAAVYVVVLCGDANASGGVYLDDLAYIRDNYLNETAGQSNCRCDMNLSGVIDIADMSVAQSHMNATASCTFNGTNSCALPPAPLGLAYTWDAENRLTQVVTRRDPAGTFYLGDTKVEFKYDYMGRRVRKTYSRWYNDSQDGGWNWHEQSDQLFVYDGWNVVEVLDANASNAILSKYTWGLDMSGLAGATGSAGIHGAGGIGGLLAAQDSRSGSTKNYWFLYDANGNVGQVLDATNMNSITTAAKYEYDPYGNTLAATGTYAAANPFRFSTKWFDTETGLSYYGYRYYNARLGRWMSRDPIEESGGLGLYSYVGNLPVARTDALGQSDVTAAVGWLACWCVGNAVGAQTEAQCAIEGVDHTNSAKGGRAFRHCVAACETAKQAGIKCAIGFWDRREKDPANPYDQLGLRGNSAGYDCSYGKESCWDCCMRKWRSGYLWCVTRKRGPDGKWLLAPCPRPPPDIDPPPSESPSPPDLPVKHPWDDDQWWLH